MLSLFQRKRPSVAADPSPAPAIDLPKGLLRPGSAASLLATPRRQKLLEHIWQRTSLSRRQFATLYRTPLERYAELVQQFPASESHHHAYPGGMLDHGLEIVPSYMCRSEPQIFVDVTRTRASVGLSIFASGTFWTLTSRGPL